MNGRSFPVEAARASFAPVLALARDEGSAAHRYLTSDALLRSPHSARNMSDAVHLLCELHGRHPGVIDHVLARGPAGERQGLADLAQAFRAERSYLAALVVAVGPVPSTPGQRESEGAIRAQQHAIDMLAQSDRIGCGLGASLALVVDWRAIRVVLDAAARRFGVDPAPSSLPEGAEVAALVEDLSPDPAADRAIAFGAQQIIAQHRALWDLLEARALARGDE